MLDGPLVFMDIDTQRDFLDPDGTLFVPGSGVILQNLSRLTRFAIHKKIPILATSCAHTMDEEDPEPFPPHCLVGTPGQKRIEQTDRPESVILSPTTVFSLTKLPPHLTMEKTRYDVFSRPDANAIVAAYGRDQATFVVYGVATDYCVRAAALGLRNRAQKVAVVVDAVRAIDTAGEPGQFHEFVDRGAMLVVTDAVVGEISTGDGEMAWVQP